MEGMKLCRILNPVVHGLFSLCNCSTSQLPLFLPSSLMATATCCHLPLLTSSNRTMNWRGPVSTGAHINKQQSEKAWQGSPEHQLANKLGHQQAAP